MADFGKDYKVPKVAEPPVKVPGKQGGNNTIHMKNPPPKGAARNPGASPDPMFGREFNAEADLQTLIAASKIRGDKARMGAAVAAGKAKLAKEASGKDRKGALGPLKQINSGAPVSVRQGPNNQGVRTKSVNSFDNVKGASKPNSGTKMDGQKGRW